MGEHSSARLQRHKDVIVKDCKHQSFGLNFKNTIIDFQRSKHQTLILIDGDITLIFPLFVIKILVLFSILLGFEHGTFGRIERFPAFSNFAQGGVRFYRKKGIGNAPEFFSEAARPETEFIKKNIKNYFKISFPVALHEFFLRPSEAFSRAIQRANKSKNTPNYKIQLNTETEIAYWKGFSSNIEISGTYYQTNLHEHSESYCFQDVLTLFFKGIFWRKILK